MLKKIRKITFSDWVLLAAILLVGGFHEYISCALSAAMSIWLLIRLAKEKRLTFPKNTQALAVAAVCLGYGLSCLWAVDRGMALIGFLKFLPLGLYLLCLWQQEQEGCVLRLLPYVGAAMAVISAIGMQFSAVSSLFSVAGRLAGFFQYPNTFALFLLVCELLLLKKEKRTVWDYITVPVLVAGLLYTGSRTVFVVAALANVAMLFAVSKKRGRTVLLILGGAVCLAAVILAFDESSVLRRFLNISLTESTFVGRVLYVVDALPLLLKYPFGMGYMGYFYIQQSIQTGVYSVAFIHNDFMQLLLDVGWVPTGLFLWTLGTWFFRKDVPFTSKLIVGTVCLHSLLDFDLQFIGMFLLLLLLTRQTGKTVTVKVGVPGKLAVGAAGVLSVYIGIALLLSHFGLYGAADAMYPGNTQNKLTMLEQVTQVDQADSLADEILEQNTQYFAPYTMKMKYAYSQGDFGALIRYANAAIERNPFDHTLYEEYCQMLINGIMLYGQAGDASSVQICKNELIAAQKALSDNAQRLSTLGKMIVDQPVTELSRETQDAIEKIGGQVK